MRPRPGRRGGKLRLLIALGMGAFALISYFGSSSYNPVTGEKQHLAMTPRQEIAMGLQAVPQMVEQFGGMHPDPRAQALIDQVGRRLVGQSAARDTEWQYDFHLLADPRTVNAFALPGGQIFITEALFTRFETEGQLAGVLGHEIGHVIARHSAQRIAKQNLTRGLIGAILIGAEGGATAAQTAQAVGQMITMKYGREDELESDTLGVRFMSEAGYDPRSMIQV
ncbi:MAG: M48 family metalloprotease, partial [Planctomycetota bacterium]|nr:M48 family metalloprotease [Planctomycetota bacterium]